MNSAQEPGRKHLPLKPMRKAPIWKTVLGIAGGTALTLIPAVCNPEPLPGVLVASRLKWECPDHQKGNSVQDPASTGDAPQPDDATMVV